MSKTAAKKTKSPALKHTVTLVLGDHSGDGHGRTHRQTICCNMNAAAVQKAYRAGVELCGVDLSANVAAGYEESDINLKQLQKLVTARVPCLEDLVEEAMKASDKMASLDRDFFAYIWLEIVKLGAPAFTYEYVKEKTINIGAYGLIH